MNEIVIIKESLQQVSIDQVWSRFREGVVRLVTVSAPEIHDLAEIYMELKRRGEDVSEVEYIANCLCLEAVAEGVLSAAIVARLRGHTAALKIASRLLPEEQMKLLNMNKVRVAQHGKTGIKVVDVSIEKLSLAQCSRLIDDKNQRLRPIDEQMALMKPRRDRLRPDTHTFPYKVRKDQEAELRKVAEQRHTNVLDLISRALVAQGWMSK